jgi:glycosyltransferase involved in cell wall biosynthesis
MSILLSIITPCFQAEQFISACLENVIQQKCDNIEHLIIDGGSSDRTVFILEDYASRFNHIRFVSEKDHGQSDAMNKGIGLAKGKYIGFLNVDDGYFPFTLNRIISLIQRQTSPVVLVGNCKLVNQQHHILYQNRPTRLQAYHLYSGLETYPINPSGYFYSKEIHDHQEVGLYDSSNHFNMDYDFFLKVCLYFPLIYNNEDWGYMLDHPEAKTNKDTRSNLLVKRRDELLTAHWKKMPFILKCKAYIYKILKKLILR